jgi:hypothetical protein
MNRRAAWIAAALGLGAVACRGDDGDKSAEVTAAAAAPAVQSVDFYRDYAALSGAELLERYGAGVTVSGEVEKRVVLGRNEGVQLWLAAPPPGQIAVRFRDGPAVRRRKIRVGEVVTVTCQLGGKPADVLFLVDCLLP